MESLEIHFKSIILSDLYCDPRKKRIQYDILDKLQIKLLPEQLLEFIKATSLYYILYNIICQ